jgi:hypothetical protein
MPAPKWKLVVDVGDIEEAVMAQSATAVCSSNTNNLQDSMHDSIASLDLAYSATVPSNTVNTVQDGSMYNTSVDMGRDPRSDEVVTLLGEYMPSDSSSVSAPFLQGFISLRLLLLRPSLSAEERDLTRTLLDSYSSYSAGGRQRADIALMLARDFIFLNQHQPQIPFLGLGPSMLSASAPSQPSGGTSYFGLPSTSSSLQNSPALAPIPIMGNHDTMSIVSN